MEPVFLNLFIQALAGQTRPCTEKSLMRLVRGRKQIKIAVLRILVKGGNVLRTGSGKKGDPYLYRLPELSQPQQNISVVEEIII